MLASDAKGKRERKRGLQKRRRRRSSQSEEVTEEACKCQEAKVKMASNVGDGGSTEASLVTFASKKKLMAPGTLDPIVVSAAVVFRGLTRLPARAAVRLLHSSTVHQSGASTGRADQAGQVT